MREGKIAEYTDVTGIDCKQKSHIVTKENYLTCKINYLNDLGEEKEVDVLGDIENSPNTELGSDKARRFGGIQSVDVEPTAFANSDRQNLPNGTPRSVSYDRNGLTVTGFDEGTKCEVNGEERGGVLLPTEIVCK